MTDLGEVRLGLAIMGPARSGKAKLLETFHAAASESSRSRLTKIDSADGRTLTYEHAEFLMGQVGDVPLYVDLYALPGEPEAELARRMILSNCNGFLFVCDRSSRYFTRCKANFEELSDYLLERGRTPEDAAVVALITDSKKKGSDSGSNRVEVYLRKRIGADRVYHCTLGDGVAIADALKKLTAQVLSRERPALEARRAGAAPPRLSAPEDLLTDIEFAHRLYLRVSGKSFSPHSDPFLGQVFMELGALDADQLEEALQLTAQASKLQLGVSLDEILQKRDMIDPDLARRGKRIRHCVEVIHEEVIWGKIAAQLEVVSFDRIKKALLMQTKRHFQYSLEQLLMRAGQLDREGRRTILRRHQEIHEAELERDAETARSSLSDAGSSRPWDSQGQRPRRPLFGEVAVNLGLVTEEQPEQCIKEQKMLRKKGEQQFLGTLLRRRGFLSDAEIPVVCKALEAKLSADRIKGYEIIKSIGRGNMALVFAARQLNLDRMVALKILDPKLLFDADFIRRFVEEARAAARLNHMNIVQAYDVGSCDELHYFAMEFVDGVTVSDLIDDPDFLDEPLTIDIIVQVARALDHAGQHKLVHRDVKPSNIMLTRDGVAKLCDLGLAKRLDQVSGDEGIILGSPYYISPEQIEGRSDIDTRADIYSLGATLFHMLTGRPPFKGRTPEDVCLKHLSEPMPDPTLLSASVTQRITPVVFKMMAKDRRHRYRDCSEVVRDLLLLRPKAGSDERRAEIARKLNAAYPTPTRRWQN